MKKLLLILPIFLLAGACNVNPCPDGQRLEIEPISVNVTDESIQFLSEDEIGDGSVVGYMNATYTARFICK